MTKNTNFEFGGEEFLIFCIGFIVLFFILFFLPFCIGRLFMYVFEVNLHHPTLASWVIGCLMMWIVSCINSLCKRK